MNYENWDWPQYLLAAWWIGFFLMACGASVATKGQKGITKAWPHHSSVAILAWILYMGGFWA